MDHYEKALAINPLYPNVWFSYGCCAMKEQLWEKASHAFSRVVQIDPEVTPLQHENFKTEEYIYIPLLHQTPTAVPSCGYLQSQVLSSSPNIEKLHRPLFVNKDRKHAHEIDLS